MIVSHKLPLMLQSRFRDNAHDKESMVPIRNLRPVGSSMVARSVFRKTRSYSTASSSSYENILSTSPRTGVGLSMTSLSSPFDMLAEVSVMVQSRSIVLEL